MRLDYFLSESIEDKGIFKACFLGGGTGSGKSYVLNNIKSGAIEPRVVNTDKFYEYFLFTKERSQEKEENRDLSRRESKVLTAKQLVGYLNSMLPMIIDTTSSKKTDTLRRKGILESIGYDTSMVFIKTSLETALKRAEKRKRHVPEWAIRKAHENTEDLITYYRSIFKSFRVVNNDDFELTDEIILSSYRKMSGFFSEPVKNPIGKEIIQKMKEGKWKYLTPNIYDMKELENVVNVWYSTNR